ncbi:3866_t:CDS:1 [Diversispora eburnea]|uniref:3866_t:CDS:1 n=1 Tax=Diversispora eburnea TaxID=1213867 RepID=A0A9N8VS56_9GLOM|nr:3866_t:CDS:1 [Diversispora eburnea]
MYNSQLNINSNTQHFQHLHKFHLTNKPTKPHTISTTTSPLPTDLLSINLPFPPVLSASEIAHKRIRSKICQKSPNAFFVYRKAFVDHLSKLSHKLKMTDVSRLVSHHWKCEKSEIKLVYENIAKEVEIELNNIRNKNLVYEDIHEKSRRKRNKQNGKNDRKSRTDNTFINFDAGANLVTTLDFSINNSFSQSDSDQSKFSSSPSSKFPEINKEFSNNIQFCDNNIYEFNEVYPDSDHNQIEYNYYCLYDDNILYYPQLGTCLDNPASSSSSGSSPIISDISENPLLFVN